MKRQGGEAAVLGIVLLVTAAQVFASTEELPQTNHLAGEASPYLQLHTHNPVDWYPWGEEALERARAESKPIFLSVGNSTCYWCHVMDRRVFSDPLPAEFDGTSPSVAVRYQACDLQRCLPPAVSHVELTEKDQVAR